MTRPVILVADDHPIFREALKIAVARAAPGALILEAGRLGEAAEATRRAERLDLVLLDLRMPGAEGFSGVALLHAERPETPILVISSADQPDAAAGARAYGAIGFVSKSADLGTIEGAIRRALAGERAPEPAAGPDPEVADMAARIARLTPAELKVLVGVLAGRLNKQIAYDLGLSEATVKGHMTVIMRKMNVQNRTQAVLAARALDLALAG
ncbi:response regulator transcription factor [Labrys wisconsinensis]|uniref:DNA-binding NarL/FixJ family response regulator n=1 Tax=Labrys wisconsinensis TaxID=425677 RepID=A0ABU0JKD0_9HYPH|nr:response regulator transcription factor [Labrys wisconsinensis]MDQ0474045.1 DNA-binding NarL/FixJ family response regulator [Labrys wisconsinensis]